jgi:hypothetical protein
VSGVACFGGSRLAAGDPNGANGSIGDDALWAITAYFNPVGYRRRLTNFRLFRKHLAVPLLAVELSYGKDFELRESDADILVQLRGDDVLWQKERLLNLALKALPPACRAVAWLDCDIVFEAADWPSRTMRALERFVLVQPFSHLHYMRPDWSPGRPPASDECPHHPPAFLIASGLSVEACLANPIVRTDHAPGMAWAAHRDFLQRHSFYDACIVGGADSVIVRAAYGCLHDATRLQRMSSRKMEHYFAWAQPFHRSVRGSVGFVDGNLFHLWHGSLQDRRYHARQSALAPFDFDPYSDIALDGNGVWRWNSDKPGMHQYVRDYFAARHEDGALEAAAVA